MNSFGHPDDPENVPRADDDPTTPDDLDQSIAEFVQDIEELSTRSAPESVALVGPVVPGTPVVSRGSIDIDLERIVRRLDVLHESLSAAHEAASKPRAPEHGIFSAVHERRASVHVYSSSVKSAHRRDYVLGVSITTAKPRATDFPRVWHIMAGILLIGGTAIWLGTRQPPGETPAAAGTAPPARIAAPSGQPAAAPPQVRIAPAAAAAALPRPPATTPRRAEPSVKIASVVQRSLPRAAPQPPPLQAAPPAPAPPAGAVDDAEAALSAIKKIASRAGPLPDRIRTEAPKTDAGEVKDAPAVPAIKFLPAYPAEARRDGITGKVELLVSIDENGKVVDVSPLSGPEPLRAAAVQAVMQWHFRPAIRDGVGVPSTARYTIPFDGTD
jgi:periplasmic protein TonB